MQKFTKKALSQAVVTSTLLLFSQVTSAVVNIVTDLDVPVTIDASDATLKGTKDTFIKASGGLVQLLDNQNNPYYQATGGSILVTGALDAVTFVPTSLGDTGTLTVENSITQRPADISADRSAIVYNAQGLNTTTSVIKLLKGSIVQSTGVAPFGNTAVVRDISAANNTIVIENDGTLLNLGTGLNSGAIITNNKSTSVSITNTSNGVIQAGPNALVAIDLNVVQNPIAKIFNAGLILAPSGTAIQAFGVTSNVVNSFINTGTIRGNGAIFPVINFTGKVSDVILQGGLVDSGSATNQAISTGGDVNISGGSVTGIITAGGPTKKINIYPGLGATYSTNGVMNGAGNINVLNGTVILNNDVTTPFVNVNPNATLVINNARNIVGGKLNLNTKTSAIDASAIVNFDITSTTSFGQLNTINGSDIGTSRIVVTNNGNGYIANNTNMVILNSNGLLQTGANAVVVLPTSAVYRYAATVNANNVTINVLRRPLDNFGRGYVRPLVSGVGLMLEAIGPTTTDLDMLRVLGAIGRMQTELEVEDALRQLVPPTNHMEMHPAIFANQQALDVIGTRLNKGYSAGASTIEQKFWLQGFGSHARQNLRKRISGYKSDTGGLVIGSDIKAFEDVRLGVAFTFSTTHSKSQTVPKNQDHLKSYLYSIYGAYEVGCGWYEGMFGLANLRHKGIRRIVMPGIAASARNKHHGHEWVTRFAYGHAFRNNLGWTVAPMVSATLSKVYERDYDEYGAGGFNLRVQNHSTDLLNLGAKLKLAYPMETVNGFFVPEFRIGLSADVVSSQDKVDVAFIPTSLNIKVKGLNPTKGAVDAGAGFSLKPTKDFSFNVQYDAVIKQDYMSHTGFVTLHYDW